MAWALGLACSPQMSESTLQATGVIALVVTCKRNRYRFQKAILYNVNTCHGAAWKTNYTLV
ncbi:hypothetical protein N7508_004389 [Penicillium antarcticum]|uniref:uncharacterized protein n=1 Tax=Penicillium antarcticum TaxID=416450 RepID=UPI00239AE72B|nr:uncharacterized protein N7508_004389 [Penicillium antarcticum]KAJ5309010.1 hypothetical protein N7508_004389 [Penicillium antarcticum]